jgi:hypothetical protein
MGDRRSAQLPDRWTCFCFQREEVHHVERRSRGYIASATRQGGTGAADTG